MVNKNTAFAPVAGRQAVRIGFYFRSAKQRIDLLSAPNFRHPFPIHFEFEPLGLDEMHSFRARLTLGTLIGCEAENLNDIEQQC
jgi:hypothetical protein